jgi:hypothetical protein
VSVTKPVPDFHETWPALPLSEWAETYGTLHMWTQIVGKVRLALSPHVNHWWQVPLYVSAKGLTTSPIPYGNVIFEIEFDFLAHTLNIFTNQGENKSMRLHARTVADFYAEFLGLLQSLDINVKIWPMPVEVPDPIRFDLDRTHASYDPKFANSFWQILVTTDCLFKEFRSHFVGKVSPVHFFWGSFDLAVTRFSGRPAPERAGVDQMTREAYSHEVSSVGFWPGGGEIKGPAFYSYAAPPPAGFAERPIRPANAFFQAQMGEFLLMYDDVRASESPRDALLEFCQSTYEAAADLGKWDRRALER